MGPFKCPDCGLWWAGFEHRCQPTPASHRSSITWPGSNQTNGVPFCALCQKYHLPGDGMRNVTITYDPTAAKF